LSPYQANGRLSGFGSPAKRHISGLDFIAANPSYVEIPAAFTQLDFTHEDFSAISKIRLDDSTVNRRLFYRGLVDVDGWYFYVHANGYISMVTNQAAAYQESHGTNGSIAINTDYTIGFSRSGASVRLYVDGVEDINVADVHIDPLTCARTAKIGIHNDLLTGAWDGRIEFLYIYGRRYLSKAEHRAIHENPYAPYGYKLFV